MNGVIDLVTQTQAPPVTADQLDLVKKTIAAGATADELKLYLYDCQRQGVHPLDKLIHFTKRNGKYTPITSIDFMRIRAADSGEYAGSEDAAFVGEGITDQRFAATVTVYRFVQGQKCAFTATARWTEYKPDQDFMWRKMPHTMLGKCAEALALRKGFPKQLAGLYAKEEMEQAGAGNGTTTTAGPAPAPTQVVLAPEGFDNWLTDLEVVAGEGTLKLKAAWTQSKAAYRLHLTKIDPEAWEALKAKAAQMDHAVSA